MEKNIAAQKKKVKKNKEALLLFVVKILRVTHVK
jgi:hypothetical protein